MARMSDFTASRRASLEALDCPAFETAPWVEAPPLTEGRVALLSTAGLMRRGERPVPANDTRFRLIAHDAPGNDVLMSHVSTGFDRSGFMRDLNVVLPRDRLDALVANGEVGSAAPQHLSFMGATVPAKMEAHARKAARLLRDDGVTHVLGLPV